MQEYREFLTVLKEKILHARNNAVRFVNQELILLYWYMGKEILQQQKKMVGVQKL